jgi:hypothetical protein
LFYGVKAVRFIMASHSQLKYGARLINSYLANNATISCCEVLNSLIFPAHEQHHNNSFLCASLVMGQSNIAAGATIGSNHNSRGADGEIIMGRGFWPGLCVSLKHNSRFASFSILTKGDYPAELDIPFPFSLISNDTSKDQLTIMPGYWFLYNMYALARNAWKYVDRDKRAEKIQHIEYDYLAPDTINEMFHAMALMEKYTGEAYLRSGFPAQKNQDPAIIGRQLLSSGNKIVHELDITAEGIENSKRKVLLLKVLQAYRVFGELIRLYGVQALLQCIQESSVKSITEILQQLPAKTERTQWNNVGGQLIPTPDLALLKEKIRTGKLKSWDAVHEWYQQQGSRYALQKQQHALAALAEITGYTLRRMDASQVSNLLNEAISTREWMTKGIYDARAKDYANPFRKMVYENMAEMNVVTGKLEDNSFIKQQVEALKQFKTEIASLKKKFKLR